MTLLILTFPLVPPGGQKCLSSSEMSEHLPVQACMVPRGCILMTPDFSSSAFMRLIFLA